MPTSYQPLPPKQNKTAPAGGNGFQELAGYIFGNNSTRAKMEMTTPVLSEPSPDGGGARMQFPMEERFPGPEALPAPLDSRVETKRVGARYVAGRWAEGEAPLKGGHDHGAHGATAFFGSPAHIAPLVAPPRAPQPSRLLSVIPTCCQNIPDRRVRPLSEPIHAGPTPRPPPPQPRNPAAAKFPGWPLEFEVVAAERDLRGALLRDGLQPAIGYRLARYNDPFTPPFLRRNEVLIDLSDFEWP